MKTGLFTRPVDAGLSAVFCSILAGQASATSVYTPGSPGVSRAGASSYGINLTMPPGTAGMVPSLGFSYGSSDECRPLGSNGSLPTGLSPLSDMDRALGAGFSVAGIGWVFSC